MNIVINAKKERVKIGANQRRQMIVGYLFMSPWIIGFLLLTAYPFIRTIYLSFFDVALTIEGWQINFSGLNNYDIALFRNINFVPNLISFIIMEITYAPAITVIAFILALLLNRGLKGQTWFRALFFLPVIVMSGPVMYQLLDSGGLTGIQIDSMMLFSMVNALSATMAQALVFLFENYSVLLWFTGIPIILFINGLQKIDGSILEAAKIDSATSWQILWKISIPMLKPIILVAFIITIVQLAGYTLNPVLPQIQDSIHQTVGGLGLASAFAWIYSFVVLALIGVAYLFLRSPEEKVPPVVKTRPKAWNEQ